MCNNKSMLAAKDRVRGLTPAQYELVNMLSCLHKESDIAELKAVLVQFLNVRVQLLTKTSS